jgi:uncharacterized protein
MNYIHKKGGSSIRIPAIFLRKGLFAGLLFLFPFFQVQVLLAQNIPAKPNPPRLVNDFANMLMPSQVTALEQRLDTYNDSTSTQIVIVTVPTVGDYAMVDYAVKLGRDWGVGGKQFNNGIVILVSQNDHKVFIATGYGMEGSVPDAVCKEIIDNVIIPNFKTAELL